LPSQPKNSFHVKFHEYKVYCQEYVLAKAWDILQIAERANGLSDEDADNADKYVEGKAGALLAYCRCRVQEPVEYRAD
jgi:hypothetical protein